MTYVLTQASAQDAFSAINKVLRDAQVRSNAVIAASSFSINDAISFAEYIDRQDQSLDNIIPFVDTQALIDYAQAQFNDPAYDAQAEFTASRAAMNAIATFIDTNIPRDAGVLVTPYDWSLATGRTPTFLSGAQKTALNVEVQLFLDTLS